MKILNRYSGLGGNRKLWGDDNDITAHEKDGTIAKFYRDKFKNDNTYEKYTNKKQKNK